MAESIHRFDKLARFGIRDIKQFALREITGADQIAAAERAGAGAGSAAINREFLAEAIAEVNGEPVTRPYYGFQKWKAKTMALLLEAHERVNALSQKDRDGFFAAFFPEPEVSASASSESGTDTPGT